MKKVGAISLAFLLLLAVGIEGIVTDRKNGCKCNPRDSFGSVPVKLIEDLQVLPASPSCNKLEYIVTLKRSGRQGCLDPTSRGVQTMYKRYLALKKTQSIRRQIRHQ